MGFLQNLFSNKSEPNMGYKYEIITDKGNGFYAWDGNLYKSDIIRSCIRPKAKGIGKLIAKHIRDSVEGIKINPEAYMRFLLEEPNPYMTGQMMQEKLATQLALNNNAFALIIKDEFGYPYQIYPIPCMYVEAIHKENGLFLKFSLKNGKTLMLSYDDVIHLRQDFNENDIFGDKPAEALKSLMEIVNTTDQGIIKAIKNSAVVKWIMMFKSVLKREDKELQVTDFTKNYLSIENESGGVATSDPRYELKEVDPKSYVPNAAQMKETTQRIYNFFNTNEQIVQSKYNEDQWNAYYESEIEPLAMQMSNEYTRKLFTRKERGFGNKIIFEASNLQYASMSTKLGLVAMVDRGAMTPNKWCEIMGLPPVEGGEKPIRRLDTAVVEGGEK